MSIKKMGEMSIYGLIIAITLALLFSPLFMYIQARQAVTVTRENIELSLQDRSKYILNELYDDIKDVNSDNAMFNALSSNSYLKNEMAGDILINIGFKEEAKEYTLNNTKIISPKIRLIQKDTNEYVLKMSYNLKQSLSALGQTFYVYSNFYYSECCLSRNPNYKDKGNTEVQNSEVNYKKFTKVFNLSKSKKEGDNVKGYLSADGKKLYIDGIGNMKNFNGDSHPWGSSIDENAEDLLEEVYFKGSINNIGSDAFSHCKKLELISLNDSIKRIENFAFTDCSSLRELDIPNSINFIGSNAFVNCSNLKTIRINLSESAFNYLILKSLKESSATSPHFSTNDVEIYLSNLDPDESEYIYYNTEKYQQYCDFLHS